MRRSITLPRAGFRHEPVHLKKGARAFPAQVSLISRVHPKVFTAPFFPPPLFLIPFLIPFLFFLQSDVSALGKIDSKPQSFKTLEILLSRRTAQLNWLP